MKKIFFIVLILLFPVLIFAQPLIWNTESLQRGRSDMSSESVKLLIRDADRELNYTILTVVDKEMVPPSGEKHDYMSMGPYWWPNPNTADGLPYIRKDGLRNPEVEKLDRVPLSRMARGVRVLSLAYFLTNDDKYAEKAVEHLSKWFLDEKTRMNPHLNFGQTIPGHNNGMGRGIGIIDTYSFVEVLEGIELLRKSKKFTKKIDEGLNAWFKAYLDWMLTSPLGMDEYNAKNNHGTTFDSQIIRFALFVGKKDIARKFVSDFPARRIFTQIEPDGSQPLELARTTAFGYSVFNLRHYMDIFYMARSLGVELFNATSPDGRSFTKAIDFILPFSGTNEEDFPYEQIHSWDRVQQDLALLLYRVDNFNKTNTYRQYYENYIGPNVRNTNLITF